MDNGRSAGLQTLVFALVAAAFTTVYITQPILPVLVGEFGVGIAAASLSVSAVTLGMALSNLPFGLLADLLPIRRLILTGGLVVATCGLVCAASAGFGLLVAARFIQGLFIPALTTCLAAYLARNLPPDRLNVVMGSYVSATVVGGLAGRLLGGYIHPPLHWRYAFVTASVLLLGAALAAARWLPPGARPAQSAEPDGGFIALLTRRDLGPIFWVPFGGFFVFSSTFNYLPFYLSRPPFNASTEFITSLYLSYLVGVVMGPLAGKLSNRIGNGLAMVGGSLIFAAALCLSLIPLVVAVLAALIGVCAGFFTIHAAAAGLINRKLTGARGRANSLYVLLYYLGGSTGITVNGYAYSFWGWGGVVALGCLVLLLPLVLGWREHRAA